MVEIRETFNLLSKSEKHCYIELNKLGNKISSMSINEVCISTGVSTATINRLIKKLGYSNFKDLKRNCLTTEVNVQDNYDDFIIDLIKNVEQLKIDYIVNSIENSRNIYLVAFGASNSLGLEAAIYLNKIGYNALAISDNILFESLISSTLGKDDTIIYISYSGNDYDLQDISGRVKNFCKQMLITTNSDSEMVKICDYYISTNSYSIDKYIRSRLPLSIILYKTLRDIPIRQA